MPQAPQPGTAGEIPSPRVAEQESGGKEVARPGGVHHPRNLHRLDHMHLVAFHDDAAGRRAREHRKLAVGPHRLQGLVESLDPVERRDLGLVGEDDIDTGADEIEEALAMAFDAERIGQRQGGQSARRPGRARRLEKSRLCARRIPQVALEIGDSRGRNDLRFDVVGRQRHRRAEIGIHGALALRGHHDQAARGRRPGAGRRSVKSDAGGADVVGEDLAQLVVLHPADEGGVAAKRSDAGNSVGHRTTGHLNRRPHRSIEALGIGLIDEPHGALDETLDNEEVVVDARQHIDDGVADAEDIVGAVGHCSPLTQEVGRRSIGGLAVSAMPSALPGQQATEKGQPCWRPHCGRFAIRSHRDCAGCCGRRSA
jgi:hypothetical protein